jgi:hypothetical protein
MSAFEDCASQISCAQGSQPKSQFHGGSQRAILRFVSKTTAAAKWHDVRHGLRTPGGRLLNRCGVRIRT